MTATLPVGRTRSPGNKYREERPLTGDESRVAEVKDVKWPKLLDPVDDVPPATIITSVRRDGDKLVIHGVSHDNGDIVSVSVNGDIAKVVAAKMGVVDWQAETAVPADGKLVAFAKDGAGNIEQTAHKTTLANVMVAKGISRPPAVASAR